MAEPSPPRYFFAALPDPQARARIDAEAGSAAAALESALPVDPADYHVTLAYVGAVPQPQVAVLEGIGASRRARRFALCLDHLDYWPRPRVLVAAASVTPRELRTLAQTLREECAAAIEGFEAAPHELVPHVTVARKVTQAPVGTALRPITWTVGAFHLMRSSAAGATPRYTVVDTWPLLDESAGG